MRYVLALALVVCGCSKPPSPQEKARSKARESLEKAVKTWGDLDAVRRRFFEMVPKIEKNPELRTELGAMERQSQELAQEYKKALDAAKTASQMMLTENPADVDALDVAATVAFRYGEFDEAAAHLEKLAVARPDDARIPSRKAAVLRAKQQYAAARALLKPVLDANPNEPTALAEDGANAFALNDFEISVARLEAAARNRASVTGDMAFEVDGMLKEARETLAHWKREADIRAAEAKANDLPRVKLETAKGDIVLELFENDAPNTVANFIDLIDKQFFDGTRFHRVVPNFMIQGGDPNSRDPESKETGKGGPGYQIKCEIPEGKYRHHFRGSISMAHAGPDTGGSQFFITHRPTTHLDAKHTVFGRVVEGQDVVDKIEAKDVINRASVLRKRDHEYRPVLRD